MVIFFYFLMGDIFLHIPISLRLRKIINNESTAPHHPSQHTLQPVRGTRIAFIHWQRLTYDGFEHASPTFPARGLDMVVVDSCLESPQGFYIPSAIPALFFESFLNPDTCFLGSHLNPKNAYGISMETRRSLLLVF